MLIARSDDVALLVLRRVERGWPPALGATAQPILHLVHRLGDGRGDPASPQVSPDAPAGVSLVAQHMAGPGPGPSPAASADPDPGHDRLEGQRVVPVPRRGHPRDRPAARVSGKVNLGGQPAAGTTERFPAGLRGRFLVIRLRPLCQPPAVRRAPRRHLQAVDSGHRRRADGHELRRRPHRRSTRRLRADRRHGATRRATPPKFRPLTSGDAGCRRSSTVRNSGARHATATRIGSARALR